MAVTTPSRFLFSQTKIMFSTKREAPMKVETLTIEGMSCGHCVKAVKEAIEGAGGKTEKVEVGTAQFQYDETKISREKIVLAIEEEGYKVIGA
jgi:copper chaperone